MDYPLFTDDDDRLLWLMENCIRVKVSNELHDILQKRMNK